MLSLINISPLQTFVYDNNLYYQSDPMTIPTKMTESGRLKTVFNGIPDWLYEGENSLIHSEIKALK